jgi:hypothetical protein
LLAAEELDGGSEAGAGRGKFHVHLGGGLVGEVGEQGFGKFVGAEKCLSFVLLAAVHNFLNVIRCVIAQCTKKHPR